MAAVIAGVIGAVQSLSFLVAGGRHGAAADGPPSEAAGPIVALLLLAMVWLLFGVPNRAHKVGLDKDRYAHVLVRVVAAAVCALTGTYLLLLNLLGLAAAESPRRHAGQHVHGPLVAGIVFATVLVWPFYSSEEVQIAFDRYAEDKAASCRGKAQGGEETDQDRMSAAAAERTT